MADNKSPDIQKMVTDALIGVPGFLKSGLADNLRVIEAPREEGYDGHAAMASIAANDPNTIRIHEAETLRNATPAQRTALLAHELTHRQMDQAAPGIKFQKINTLDPYFYQERELAGTKINDWSPEQLARMVETNTAYQNDPTITAARKAQVASVYKPILSQLSQLPQATINTQQPASNAINTTANAPAGVQFDSAPLVQPTETGATDGHSDWEDDNSQFMVENSPKGMVESGNLPIWNRPTVQNADGSHSSEYSTSFQDDKGREVLVPTVVNGKFTTPDGKKPEEGSPAEKAMFQAAWQHYLKTGEHLGKFSNSDDANTYAGKLHNRAPKGSGIQTSDDWEDVAPPSHAEQNQHNLREGLKGAGKLALQAIVGDPSVASINPLVHARQLSNDQELNSDLTASNGEQVAGKIAAGGAGLLLGAGSKAIDSIPEGVKALTSAGKARMGSLLDSNISGALHNDLGSTLSKVAQEAGVDVEPTSDVRKAVGNVATAIRDKAKSKLAEVDELFKGLSDDDAPAGLEHYSDIQNAITKKEKDLNMLRSSTPAKPTWPTSDAISAAQKAEQKATALRSELQALKGQKETADAALDAQGLQGAREQADHLFEQADALDKLRKAHAKSTFGGPGSGQTNPAKFHEQLGELHDSGELHAALGEDHAQNLMDSTGRASRLLDRNAKIRKYGAIGAGAIGAGKLVSGAAHLSEFIP